jgi:hypothetical protein
LAIIHRGNRALIDESQDALDLSVT